MLYVQTTSAFHHHRRHHCQRAHPAGVKTRAFQRGAACPSAGIERAVLPGNAGAVQHRQHRPRAGALAHDGTRHSGKLRLVRWLYHLPRHGYAGVLCGGALLPDSERGQAHHPHRRTAAHLQRDHGCQEKPAGQRGLRHRPGQPGRNGGVWRARHCGHSCQEEQDHQLRRLCLSQLPGAGAGAG